MDGVIGVSNNDGHGIDVNEIYTNKVNNVATYVATIHFKV